MTYVWGGSYPEAVASGAELLGRPCRSALKVAALSNTSDTGLCTSKGQTDWLLGDTAGAAGGQ